MPASCRGARGAEADLLQDHVDRLLGEGMQLGGGPVLHGVRHVNRCRVEADRRFLLLEGLAEFLGQHADAGQAARSRSFRSCVEQDVHEPQSDSAMMTAWQFAAISWIISRGATRVLVGFL